MYNIYFNTADTPDPKSKLNKVYRYLWDNPDSVVIPEEYMPFDHQIHYIFNQVKNLRKGTNLPELTLEELKEILDEEKPGWREDKPELPDWFLDKYELIKPNIKLT